MKYLKKIFLFSVFLCLSAAMVFGQQPDAGVAAGFAAFTGVGAFGVTGPAGVYGDVGTNAGTFTGFPPGTLSGQKHIQNVASQQAAVATGLLYNDLSGRTCGSVINIAMGNGQILTPGVYCTGAASTLSGNLILDGLNDPNSVFIIQINGALSSISSTNVTLINKASSCNVFWQINGMFTLEGAADFKGTAVVEGAVSLLGTATIEGRVLATNGAINMAANTITPCELVLPVRLMSFDASLNKNEKTVSLHWQTASESNSDHFIIEKSDDGIHYNYLSKISASGQSQKMTSYTYIDLEPLKSINYYRLKQVDTNGSFEYSNHVLIDLNPVSIEFKVFPNPVSSILNIQLLTNTEIQGLIFELYGAEGQIIKSIKLNSANCTLNIADLHSGQYYYVFKNATTILNKGMVLIP